MYKKLLFSPEPSTRSNILSIILSLYTWILHILGCVPRPAVHCLGQTAIDFGLKQKFPIINVASGGWVDALKGPWEL